jgi:hypothetical protein
MPCGIFILFSWHFDDIHLVGLESADAGSGFTPSEALYRLENVSEKVAADMSTNDSPILRVCFLIK